MLAVLAAACSPSDGADRAPIESTPVTESAQSNAVSSTTAPVPVVSLPSDPAAATFDSEPCEVQMALVPLPRCGTVTVPAHWDTGLGALELAVMVLRSTSEEPAPDPVVYLGGGPGQHTLASIPALMPVLSRLRARGDVVVIDQRGMGFSQPALECPEVSDAARSIEEGLDLTDEEVAGSMRDGLELCGAQLRQQGVDLSAFTTIENAHDIEAVRWALGYPAWNLYGGSYGSRLALEVVRQHPDGVRSMALDAVYTPDADFVVDGALANRASLDAVAAACRAEPACRSQGDLLERIRAEVAVLDEAPLVISLTDPTTGEVDIVTVDGRLASQMILVMLRTVYFFVDLPELLTQLEQRNGAGVGTVLNALRAGDEVLSLGAFWAFTCNEEVPFADPAAVEAAVPADPFGRQERFDGALPNSGPEAFESCRAFGLSGEPDPVLNQPVESAVPALLLAGRYDPRTPAAWAESAAEHLSAGHLLIDPNGSHGVVGSPCTLDLLMDFLDDPKAEPERTCFGPGRLPFVDSLRTPAPAMPTVTYPSTDGASLITTVRPEGWSLSPDGDAAWRRETVLDPAVLIQDAGGTGLVVTMASIVLAEFGVQMEGSEKVTRHGRTWLHRTGTGPTATLEWFETDIDGRSVIVVLAAPPADLDRLRRGVLNPALDAIELG
ncbi:MAG: alpha/beta fold hydrolase [Acidimicrobiales bacterium]